MWKSSQDESFERDFPPLTKERYTLNATSLSKALKKPRNALLQFLDGKSLKPSLVLGFHCYKSRTSPLLDAVLISNPFPCTSPPRDITKHFQSIGGIFGG